MNRLTYTKIVNSAIEINLHDAYSVIAVILQNENTKKENHVSFYLKNSKTNTIIPIDDLEDICFEVELNRLYPEILKCTYTLLNNGTFEKHIEKYNQDVIKYFYDFHKTLDVMDGE